MDVIEIRRRPELTNNRALHGDLYLNGEKIGVTLERDDVAIPKGSYPARLYQSPKFGRTVILLENVPGRTATEIHPGNTIKDTEGCILPGLNRSGNYVTRSRATLERLLDSLSSTGKFKVIIK